MRRAFLVASLVGMVLSGCGVAPVVQPAAQPAVAQQAAVPADTVDPESLRYTTLNLLDITPKDVEALKVLHISSAADLLHAAATARSRQQIAARTGIPQSRLLRWVNYVDLMRITGVGPQYSFLLETAGVDTVVELSNRNPVNLFKTLKTANERNYVKRLPTADQVTAWVAKANKAPRIVEY